MFKYRITKGECFPYLIFFTNDALKYYTSYSSKIETLCFVPTTVANAETINQIQVFELWEKVRASRTSIDTIYFEYRVDDDLVDHMLLKGYNERDIVSLIRIFPPVKIRLYNQLTLQSLKAIYSIMWDNY